jgi:hypothetical protein
MRPHLVAISIIGLLASAAVAVAVLSAPGEADADHTRASVDSILDQVNASDDVAAWTMKPVPSSMMNGQYGIEFSNPDLWWFHSQEFLVARRFDGSYRMSIYDDSNADYIVSLDGSPNGPACDDSVSTPKNVCQYLTDGDWKKTYDVLLAYAKKRDSKL